MKYPWKPVPHSHFGHQRCQVGTQADALRLTGQYFDGCPNWQRTVELVRQALSAAGEPESALTLQAVQIAEEADRVGFRGSPTVLVEGTDPFAEPTAPVGLSCRVFPTPDGIVGAPTLEQLTAALRAGQRQT